MCICLVEPTGTENIEFELALLWHPLSVRGKKNTALTSDPSNGIWKPFRGVKHSKTRWKLKCLC